MDADNPYEPPRENSDSATPAVPLSRTMGNLVLTAGLGLLSYGAVAFWIIQTLPPNGPGRGRLPSVYVMGAGIVIAFLGLIVRDLRIRRKTKEASPKGISTSFGILILLGMVVIFILVVSLL